MGRLLLKLCALLTVLGLPACDGYILAQLKPGLSAAQVQELMGRPSMEWRHEDGSQTWEYTRQPEGMRCYMLTLSAQGVLQQVEQVITPENLARIRPGLSQDQVRRLLGKPRSVQFFSLKQEEVWDWKVDKEITRDVFFNVHFNPQGQVVTTSQSVDMR